MAGGKICFRGDTRTPNAPDEIFKKGFSRRVNATTPYRYRPRQDPLTGKVVAAGDLEPRSAVCVSARLRAAALFPLREPHDDCTIGDTWIYAIYVELRRLMNTHAIQVTDGLLGVEQGTHPQDALWPLYAHELATDRIPGKQVIAAVKCRRWWNGSGGWRAGARYHLEEIAWNGGCEIPEEYEDAATVFLNTQLMDHAWGETPKAESAYEPSVPLKHAQ